MGNRLQNGCPSLFSTPIGYHGFIMQLPKRKPPKYGDPADNYLTPEAIAKLRSDIEHLEKRVRPKAVEDLRRAADMGDRSDNAAYSEARGRLTGLDVRLQTLQERLKYAVPIKTGDSDKIVLGSTATVEIDGKTKTYSIVGAQEANPGAGRISYHSPLGAALMGHRADDEFEAALGDKTARCRIISVS